MDDRVFADGETGGGGSVVETIAAAVFFAVVAFWWFGANLFAGEIVAPMDLLVRRPGWAESGFEWPLSKTLASDIVNAFLPRWIFVRDEILQGNLPLWTPIPTGGQPAFGILSDGYLTPRFLLFLAFDEGLGFTLGLIVQAVICGLGAYRLCRMELGVVPALFAGVTYMMCGFNAFWTMWQQTMTAAWIPWVLWALVRLAERPSARRASLLAVFVAASIFGGYPPVAAFGLYAAALLALWLMATKSRSGSHPFRFALWSAAGVALGFGLTGLQLVPFADYLGQLDLSHRHGGLSGVPDLSTIWTARPEGRTGNVAYVGLAALGLSALSVPAAMVGGRLRGALSPAFWFPLTALALATAFGRPEPLANFLYQLPVLNFALSSRLFVLYALGTAVLGAVGLAALLRGVGVVTARLTRRRVMSAVVTGGLGAVMLLLQLHDLAPLGRDQNPVVPAGIFYPQTPALRHLGDRMVPGQSVVATDDAFGASGPLGGRGFAEWFAHAFHAAGEKAVLDRLVRNPWSSPTAAEIQLGQVTFDPEWFDALGVCCVLASRGSLIAQARRDRPSPGVPPHRIGQTLRLFHGSVIEGVEIAIGRGRWQVGGRPLELEWLDAGGRRIAGARTVGNRQVWVRFPFDPALRLERGEYRFELSLPGDGEEQARAWIRQQKSRYRDGHLTIDGKEASGDLTFRVSGAPILDERRWRAVAPGPNVVVFERTASPPGAYLVPPGCPTDEPRRDCMEWKDLAVVEVSSDRAVYRVESPGGGLLVRTMRRWPGWKAFVNGREAPVGSHLGILPAVAVEAGTSTVEWRYEPWSWTAGLALSGISLLVLLSLVLAPRRPASSGGSGSPR